MKLVYSEEFKKSFDKLFHWKYAPLRFFKAILYIPHNIKHLIQRMVRGYSCKDLFGFDYYLAEMLGKALRDFKKGNPGYPSSFASAEEWDKELDKMIEGFDAAHRFLNDDKPRDADTAIFQRGMESFTKYFFNLWQ